jgi:deoxyribose-phosphate aldolase
VSGAFSKALTGCVEYTLHTAAAKRGDVEKLCTDAKDYQFHSVCVNVSRIELARTLLEDTDVKVTALIGWPLGATDTDVKRYEAEVAADLGAHEIDYVINLGCLKDGNTGSVLREMRDIVEAADERPVKAVIESHLLTRVEKIEVCKMAIDSGVKFISTATGYHTPSADLDDIALLKETMGNEVGIKVFAFLRDAATLQQYLEAGATRLGILREG